MGAGELPVFQWTIHPPAHVESLTELNGLKSIVFQETVEDRRLGGRCDIGFWGKVSSIYDQGTSYTSMTFSKNKSKF